MSKRDGTKTETPRTRITCQFRNKSSMVYEFDCDGIRLCITMQDTPQEGWQVGAALREDGAPTLSASAASRNEGVRSVAEAWARANYARIDWDAVVTALKAVRAV